MRTEYSVVDEWVKRITDWAGFVPDVDAFASRKNKRFPKYWDLTKNAFCQNWSKNKLWINPPFDLLERIINEIVEQGAYGIIVVPVWRSEVWWKPLSNLAIDWVDIPGLGHTTYNTSYAS